MLSARPDDLDESVFQRLVDDRVAEHQRLDFKRELPGDTKDSRREHARDVAAMANGGGGLLIFGVAEEDDAAAEITPVPLGDEVTRLRQVTNSLLEPYLHLEIEEVEVGDDPGQGVIVVSVPSSARRPFAVVEGSRLGYFRRTGRNRHPMDEAEVARMYTERVDRLQSVSQRLHELTTGVANRIADLAIGALPEEETLASRPIAYLAVAPVEAYSRLFRPDPQTLGVISNIAVGRVFGIPEYGEILPRDYRPGFKRVDIAHGFTPRLLVYGWSELHDDGSFVGVIVGRPPGFEPAHQLNDGTQLAGFYDVQLAVQSLLASQDSAH